MTLNLWWGASKRGRAAQAEAVSQAAEQLGEGPIVLALQEVKPKAIERFADAGWDVLASTQAPKGRLGVAILAQGIDQHGEAHQPERSWFDHGEVYPELAEWFVERSVAVDVTLGGTTIRFGSFHATPGKSKGPGKRGVGGARKPWFHRGIADWIAATWTAPYAFAIDANTPDRETLDSVKYMVPRGARCEAGEDHLLGIRQLGNPPRHRADDLLRTWLATPAGAERHRELLGDDTGPLAVSHYTGSTARRFDHLWATPELVPTMVRYWPLSSPLPPGSVSDHALVGAQVVVPG